MLTFRVRRRQLGIDEAEKKNKSSSFDIIKMNEVKRTTEAGRDSCRKSRRHSKEWMDKITKMINEGRKSFEQIHKHIGILFKNRSEWRKWVLGE